MSGLGEIFSRKPLTRKQILEKLKEETGTGKLGFCENSRRWTFMFFRPSHTCPHGNDGCVNERCGYFELREPSRHIIMVMRELRWGTDKEKK